MLAKCVILPSFRTGRSWPGSSVSPQNIENTGDQGPPQAKLSLESSPTGLPFPLGLLTAASLLPPGFTFPSGLAEPQPAQPL